jgi:hypothetical protein
MLDMNYYGPFLKWFPTAVIAVSFAGTFMFFLFLFLVVRGLTRLSYLKDISLTLKRIEKLLEGKNKTT